MDDDLRFLGNVGLIKKEGFLFFSKRRLKKTNVSFPQQVFYDFYFLQSPHCGSLPVEFIDETSLKVLPNSSSAAHFFL